MTTFFNQKEDVLAVQLTPFGKQVFSMGIFNPSFYSFYDSNILYDGAYGGFSETQNNILNRIKLGTPYLKPQTSFSSSLAQVVTVDLDKSELDNISDANAKFLTPLGYNDPWSTYAPSWTVVNMPSSIGFTSGSNTSPGFYETPLQVPTISGSLATTYTSDTAIIDLGNGEEEEHQIHKLLSNDTLYLNITEENTIFKNIHNFDVEVFLIEEDENSEEILKKLYFFNENMSDRERQFLINQQDPYYYLNTLAGTLPEIEEGFPVLTPEYVDFYLHLRVDDEIIGSPPVVGSSLYTQAEQLPAEICADVIPPGVDF